MTKLLIILVSVMFSVQSYAMSFNNAQIIYNKMLHDNHMSSRIKLVLSPSQRVNASSSGGRIIINQGMLQFVRNRGELALVIGHELAHAMLHHNGSTPAHEFAADALGAQYIANAGFNRCSAVKLLLRFPGASKTHPGGLDRYNHVKC